MPSISFVTPLMSKGQFGARDLHKHLWKLPIPEFDSGNPLHVRVSQAGETAAIGAAKQLAQLRQNRDEVTVTVARREIRKWLRESSEGKAVEEAVKELLARTETLTILPRIAADAVSHQARLPPISRSL